MHFTPKNIAIAAVALCLIAALGYAFVTRTASGSIETYIVGPERVDCVGVGPQKCLVVNGEFFYSNIAGFTYEAGYRYVLRVRKEDAFPGEEPHADASRYRYTLVEIVSKEKV